MLLLRHIRRSPEAWDFTLHHLDQRTIRTRELWKLPFSCPRRLQRVLHAADAWHGCSIRYGDLRALHRQAQPDLLYGLADGPLASALWRLSRETGTPLLLQVCDWYPTGLDVPAAATTPLEARYRRMLHDCAHALCFSEEIRQAAGHPPRSSVVYPVAERPPALPPAAPLPHALFAGRFDHFLLPEMNALLRAAKASGRSGRVRIIGPDSFGDEENAALVRSTGCYDGLLKGREFHEALHNAGVLLVLAPFGSEREHLARYSFPSKIPEYCHRGRPILVWGPPYSSSVNWARTSGAAHAVTAEDPRQVLDAIDLLLRETDLSSDLVQAAAREARTRFDPARMQEIFEEAVLSAAAGRTR